MQISGNYLFVQPGQKAYKVSSNFTNYLELGVADITEYYLEARVENDAFLINAVLRDSDGAEACRVIDSFPQGPECRREMTLTGYNIFDRLDRPVLGIAVDDNICVLQGTIYDADGLIVAKTVENDFQIYRGPAVLGKSNGARGMVLG